MVEYRVTPADGNVFRDLGFSETQAAQLLVRADLLIQLQRIIASRRLTRREAAKALRISPSCLDDLRRGRLARFSTDRLLGLLARLNIDVRLVFKPARRSRRTA